MSPPIAASDRLASCAGVRIDPPLPDALPFGNGATFATFRRRYLSIASTNPGIGDEDPRDSSALGTGKTSGLEKPRPFESTARNIVGASRIRSFELSVRVFTHESLPFLSLVVKSFAELFFGPSTGRIVGWVLIPRTWDRRFRVADRGIDNCRVLPGVDVMGAMARDPHPVSVCLFGETWLHLQG